MSILALPPTPAANLVLRAQKAGEYAEIHRTACRYRRQGLVCSTCFELDQRASRLVALAGRIQARVRARLHRGVS